MLFRSRGACHPPQSGETTVPESAAHGCGAARARRRWHRKAAATPAGPRRTPALLCKTRVTLKKKKTQWFLIPVPHLHFSFPILQGQRSSPKATAAPLSSRGGEAGRGEQQRGREGGGKALQNACFLLHNLQIRISSLINAN